MQLKTEGRGRKPIMLPLLARNKHLFPHHNDNEMVELLLPEARVFMKNPDKNDVETDRKRRASLYQTVRNFRMANQGLEFQGRYVESKGEVVKKWVHSR